MAKYSPEIENILSGAQKVFSVCRAKTDFGAAFYASDPKLRYPWIYTRDLSAIISGLSYLGDHKTAKECLVFLLNVQDKDGQWHQKYDTRGQRQDVENIKPVLQEDNTPLALWALLAFAKDSGDEEFKKEIRPFVEKAIYWIRKYQEKNLSDVGLVYSTASIHQSPGYNQGFELWHNSLVVKVFSLLAEVYNEPEDDRIAAAIKKNIIEKLAVGGRFIRKIDDGGKEDFCPDIIMLSPAYFGIFQPEESLKNGLTYKEILANTLNFLQQKLWDKELGGFLRYPNFVYKEEHPFYDGKIIDPLLPGPYVVSTSIAGQAYFQVGDMKKAGDVVNWLIAHADEGRFPEHYTTAERLKKYISKESDYVLKNKKDPMYLEAWSSNLREVQKETVRKKLLSYALPLAWAEIEALKLLKLTGFINKFKIKS